MGLQYGVGNVIREGVAKETLDEVKNVPVLQEGGYTAVEDTANDWMRFEMLFEDTHWSSSNESRVKQAYAVAGEINRLIEATSHIFDVKPTTGIGKGEGRASITRVNAPCPNCGKKDLAVLSRLGDGSLRLQCMNCKSRVQAKTGPTVGQPGKALQDSGSGN